MKQKDMQERNEVRVSQFREWILVERKGQRSSVSMCVCMCKESMHKKDKEINQRNKNSKVLEGESKFHQ